MKVIAKFINFILLDQSIEIALVFYTNCKGDNFSCSHVAY